MRPSKQIFKIDSIGQLVAPARHILSLHNFAQTGRTLVLIEGVMGAGKTKFVEAVLRELDSREVTSPTFALHQTYSVSGGLRVHHFDLYRLSGEEELEASGFWDVLAARQGLVLVEWPEKLPAGLVVPGWHILRVRIDLTDGDSAGRDKSGSRTNGSGARCLTIST